MSHEEFRKLLGGYATNTLTESERQALYHAALEDQELFDALHQEQALKDLLDDPVSRAQIQNALEQPEPPRTRGAWWTRWWTWTGAASAVAAAVLIVAVTRSRPPEPVQDRVSLDATRPVDAAPPAEKRESDAEVKTVPSPPLISSQSTRARTSKRDSDTPAARHAVQENAAGARNERKDEIAAAPPPVSAPGAISPAPSLPPAAQTAQQVQPEALPNQTRASDSQAMSQQASNSAVESLRDKKQNQVAQSQLSAGVVGTLKSEPVGYSVLKREPGGAYRPLAPNIPLQNGDAVRLKVAPILSGYLSLSRMNASGDWIRIFPADGPGLRVNTNTSYTIPEVAINVTGADQRLRITLVPASDFAGYALSRNKAKVAPMKKESSAVNASLDVYVTIAPGKVP
jgi:hypothetical protein